MIGLRLVGGEQSPDRFAPIGAQQLHDVPDWPTLVQEVPIECGECHLHPRIGHAPDCRVGREQAPAKLTDWDALQTPGRRARLRWRRKERT